MAKTNVKPVSIKTHEGANASRIGAEAQLKRSVMSCMLWENEFYEDGQKIATRIKSLIPDVAPEAVSKIAVEARERMKLRHVPLLIVREMSRLATHKKYVASTLASVIQRADELSEFLSIYWKDGRQPLSAQVKKGLAKAFQKFNEYALAKYDRDGAVKLRDVLFLCHAKPKTEKGDKGLMHTRVDKATKKGSNVLRHVDGQGAVWKRLANKQLATPDTWEVELSASKDKLDSWKRLLTEKKLGGLAFLRNLRNMLEAGIEKKHVKDYAESVNVERVLPFRFISAAKAVPQWEDAIEPLMLRCLEAQEKLVGKTILIVDVSGSMYGSKISSKSDVDRAETACALAVLVREICEEPVIYATAGSDYARVHKTEIVPGRRGFALKDAIYKLCRPLGGGGIFLKQVMDYVYDKEKNTERVIVITDEQDCGVGSADSPDKANAFGKHNYIINIASNQNGIGYGKWTHINGWSESVIDYIQESERQLHG